MYTGSVMVIRAFIRMLVLKQWDTGLYSNALGSGHMYFPAQQI
jgi:hypothetical protein